MTRPFTLVEIELPAPGSGRTAAQVVKSNAELPALWDEGWDVTAIMLAHHQEQVDGQPKGQRKSVLQVLMGPPRPSALSAAVEGLERVAGQLEAPPQPEPQGRSTGPYVAIALTALSWLILIVVVAIAWQQ